MLQLIGQFYGLVGKLRGFSLAFLDGYPAFQFDVGWTLRNKIAGRQFGPVASHTMHPDAGKAFNGLKPEIRAFVDWMSMWQLLLFMSMKRVDLEQLRQCGRDSKLDVPEPLLSQVNDAHHRAWLAARNSFVALGFGSISAHDVAKEKNLMTPKEIEADNAQVKAYAFILAAMPDADFNMILSNCAA